VFVPGSRRYADPASYLMTSAQWETQRLEFCHLVGKPADPAEALSAAEAELHVALADLEEVLASGAGPVRLNERGELVIPALSAAGRRATARCGIPGAITPRLPQ